MMAAFAALLAISCQREKAYSGADAQLMVSLYIPGATMTRAETGMVNPLSEELKFTSLRIWVFLTDTGELISYKCFQNSNDKPLNQTGLPNSTITRFGLPLSDEMFRLLSATHPAVDVYAVANVESAVADVPGENWGVPTNCWAMAFAWLTLTGAAEATKTPRHANVTITMNRYVHPTLEFKRKNMNKLSSLIDESLLLSQNMPLLRTLHLSSTKSSIFDINP